MRRIIRIIGLLLILVAFLILYFGAIAYFGIRQGTKEQINRQVSTINAEVSANYAYALDDLQAENYQLAQRRIGFVLTQLPYTTDTGGITQSDALLLYEEILEEEEANRIVVPTLVVIEATATETAIPTPTPIVASTGRNNRTPNATSNSTATPTLIVTLTPRPTNTPRSDEDEVSAQLSEIEETLDSDLEQGITDILAFQIDYPAYERRQTDQMLYDALVKQAFILTNGEEVSRGVNMFEQAERLGSLDAMSAVQLNLSRLYLQGLAYRGVRWDLSILNFGDLCRSQPTFRDGCQLLFDAYLSYAEQLTFNSNPCEAAVQLEAAAQLDDSRTDLQTALSQAQFSCAGGVVQDATPTRSSGSNGAWTETPQSGNNSNDDRGSGRWTPTPKPPTGGAWTPTPKPPTGGAWTPTAPPRRR